MDQASFENLLREFQSRCSAENTIYDLTATAGQPGKPIVVLVHGIGGNSRHWSDPISLNINDTWLFDPASPPVHGATGLGTSPPYRPDAVTNWCQFLGRQGFSLVNFSQARSGDLLEYAALELAKVLRALESEVFAVFDQEAANGGETAPPLIVLSHSRGGLVTRAALKQLGSAGVPHLRKVITLCAPHQGSYMPRLAKDYNDSLHRQLDFSFIDRSLPGPVRAFFDQTVVHALNDLSNKLREALLHTFGSISQGPGFEELIPQSPTLQTLAQDEQPFPGVQYYSFAGSNPTFLHFYLCVAGFSVHLLGVGSAFLTGLLDDLPGVRAAYGGIAELGQGDSAVALERSQWPAAFNARHQVLSFNHGQALIDSPLQAAVLPILEGAV